MIFGCTGSEMNYVAIQQAGFSYIEFSALKTIAMTEKQRKELKKELSQKNFSCLGFNDFCDERVPLVGENYRLAVIREHTKRVLYAAQELGATKIGIGGPKARVLGPNFSLLQASEQVATALAIMGDLAADTDCQILWEPLSNCDFDRTVEEAGKTVQRINHPQVKLVVDFYHMFKTQEKLTDFLKWERLIAHTHFSAENHGARSLLSENYTSEWQYFYADVEKILDNSSYNGGLTLEGDFSNVTDSEFNKEYQLMKTVFHI